MNYVQIEPMTGNVVSVNLNVNAEPLPTGDGWVVYEIAKMPENFTYLVPGMNFDTVTRELTHTQQSLNVILRAYLRDTDWYVIRQIETGEAVPEEITTKRAEARANIVE